MAAFAVIEPLDVVEDIRLGFLSGSVSSPLYAFALEEREEALQGCIVEAMTTGAHAALNAMLFKYVAEVIARVLRPTV